MSVDIHDLKTVRLASGLLSWRSPRHSVGEPPRRRGQPAGPGAIPASQLVNAGVYVGAARHARREVS